MLTLREVLEDARRRRVGVGHFNVSDIAAFHAVVGAARELGVPVIIGVSEGEREFIGVREIAALVRAAREASDYPIFLNADHTHSLEKAEEAARAGFDEILFDGSKLSYEENVYQTKEAARAVRKINPNIVVEGELGYLGSSSEVLAKAPEGAALSPELFTKPGEALAFTEATGIDALAPAVGTMHGLLREMVKGKKMKRLDINRIAEIAQATDSYLTLHGGSGTAEEDLRAAVHTGITIVHVNTELRLAWRRGVEAGLKKNPDEVAPYKILPEAVQEIRKIVTSRLKLISGISG